ncbi:MAG TPA: FtsX-like permease family protein [Lichenihabitans sp.]|jgi:putative ABC transport system permease protein|nr:FtsX-like permease family protein [Lichenihabitans sp.]
MMATWIKGVLTHRWRALVLAASGLAAATALIGIVGVFASISGSTMTRRAIADLPVDWQVAIAPGSDAAALTQKLSASAPIKVARTVGYADVSGFQTTTGGTTQTTGAGQVLGMPEGYTAAFPGQIRPLLGAPKGVLIAQQAAANLHVSVGDSVSILRTGKDPIAVKIDGIVELPNADAMFQTIGPQKGPAATAPPDDVILLPFEQWTALFAKDTGIQGGSARLEIHARLDHAALPSAPTAALADATGRARNFEVRAAGVAQIGDNLAARLSAVREDALFASILLLFLGLPGIALAALLTIAVVRTEMVRRRHEHALLSLRGASVPAITRIAIAESGCVATLGTVAGVLVAGLVSATVLGADPASRAVLVWLGVALLAGLLLALASVLVPTLADLRASTVAAQRAMLVQAARPLWRRAYLDVILLVIAGLLVWRVAQTGYQIVLAPEGVAATSVDYTAFLAPLCLWIGAGLLVLRLASLALGAGRTVLAAALRPLAKRLSDPVAASIARQNRRIAGGVALATLAFAFATAVAVFAATYNAQSLVDAELTNGADVTVAGTIADPAGARLADIRHQPGVLAAEPMQHRYAYVGNDLQDLYGIDPATIGKATTIADAYFANHDARTALAGLARTPDGVLVSQETVNDFQLAIGDVINLRLQTGPDRQYHPVPFHLVGVVSEFPTAPRDSFLVANAAYVAAQTGNAHAETVLVRTAGDPSRPAAAIRTALGASSPLKVTDLAQAQRTIGSSLTAVDLRALTGIELAFAIVLAIGSTGLVLWLGLSERQRSAAILSALGASVADVRLFARAEAGIILIGGAVCGFTLGELVAAMLVRLLGGVFDPPPEALRQPLVYLALVLLVTAGALWVAAARRRPEGLEARIT